jgi:ankyrin repeat protein
MTADAWYELRNAVYGKQFAVAEALLRSDPGLVSARDGIGETVLHFLAVENDMDGVVWLHQRGFDLNTKNDFGTPAIFEVAQLVLKELLLWFVDQGADIGAVDAEGQNIIAFLREFEKDEMVQFLLEKVPNLALQVTPASGRA